MQSSGIHKKDRGAQGRRGHNGTGLGRRGCSWHGVLGQVGLTGDPLLSPVSASLPPPTKTQVHRVQFGPQHGQSHWAKHAGEPLPATPTHSSGFGGRRAGILEAWCCRGAAGGPGACGAGLLSSSLGCSVPVTTLRCPKHAGTSQGEQARVDGSGGQDCPSGAQPLGTGQ